MTDLPSRYFVYSFFPAYGIRKWLIGTGVGIFVAILIWRELPVLPHHLATLLLLIPMGFLLRLGLVERVTLIVEDGTLIVIRRPLIGLFKSSKIYLRGTLGQVRYRYEDTIVHEKGHSRKIRSYLLEVITLDKQIVPLICSEDVALEEWRVKMFTQALNVPRDELIL